jgi:NifU-like protein
MKWQFSKKLKEKLDRLRYVGHFDGAGAADRGMRFVTGREKSSTGIEVCFYLLVDESDGVIAEVKFQAFGPIGLIGAAEAASDLILRKNYDQASRISADLIDQHMRDKKEVPAFPKECYGFLNLVLSAIDRATQGCEGIAFSAATPIERDFGEIPGGIPGWLGMDKEVRLKIIEEVIDKEIRPYVELDAGNVKVVELKGQEVVISYEGSCTTCHSSTGSTLNAILQILRARVHPELSIQIA